MKYLYIPGEPDAIVWQDGTGNSGVIREGDEGWSEYQQWLTEGNTPEPARTKDTVQDRSMQERAWRNAELVLADIQLSKHDDADPAVVATAEEWRVYRRALRAWPEHASFPDSTHRPMAPAGA